MKIKETDRYGGYSLLELLLVLVIVSSILAWSVPAWQDFMEKNELESVTNDLSTLLRFARYYATHTGESVTLNALDGEDWSNGIILFPDNLKHRYQTELIHQYQWPAHHVQLKWQGFQSKQYLIFSSDQEEASLNGHFTLTTNNGKERLLVLNRLGRIATA